MSTAATIRKARSTAGARPPWPAIQAYKRHSFEQLRGETQILDVGCGPGEDAAAVSAEDAVGVDRSWAMCTRACPRVGRICQGLAEQLPFADGSFGGCRADRVLVHLADPVRALHELLRVTRPGGRIVLADPDQETLVIEVPGVRRELADAVKALRRDVGYRHGRLGAQLPALLAVGRRRRHLDRRFPLVLTDPDDAFGLPSWVTGWRELGGFDDRDVAEWDAAVARAARWAWSTWSSTSSSPARRRDGHSFGRRRLGVRRRHRVDDVPSRRTGRVVAGRTGGAEAGRRRARGCAARGGARVRRRRHRFSRRTSDHTPGRLVHARRLGRDAFGSKACTNRAASTTCSQCQRSFIAHWRRCRRRGRRSCATARHRGPSATAPCGEKRRSAATRKRFAWSLIDSRPSSPERRRVLPRRSSTATSGATCCSPTPAGSCPRSSTSRRTTARVPSPTRLSSPTRSHGTTCRSRSPSVSS